MFVPVVPHTTVVNKTIVYSDTVLSLKDKGSNLKITTISNVEEFMLDDCLRIIFESNPSVIFNTIQYSKIILQKVCTNQKYCGIITIVSG